MCSSLNFVEYARPTSGRQLVFVSLGPFFVHSANIVPLHMDPDLANLAGKTRAVRALLLPSGLCLLA